MKGKVCFLYLNLLSSLLLFSTGCKADSYDESNDAASLESIDSVNSYDSSVVSVNSAAAVPFSPSESTFNEQLSYLSNYREALRNPDISTQISQERRDVLIAAISTFLANHSLYSSEAENQLASLWRRIRLAFGHLWTLYAQANQAETDSTTYQFEDEADEGTVDSIDVLDSIESDISSVASVQPIAADPVFNHQLASLKHHLTALHNPLITTQISSQRRSHLIHDINSFLSEYTRDSVAARQQLANLSIRIRIAFGHLMMRVANFNQAETDSATQRQDDEFGSVIVGETNDDANADADEGLDSASLADTDSQINRRQRLSKYWY